MRHTVLLVAGRAIAFILYRNLLLQCRKMLKNQNFMYAVLHNCDTKQKMGKKKFRCVYEYL